MPTDQEVKDAQQKAADLQAAKQKEDEEKVAEDARKQKQKEELAAQQAALQAQQADVNKKLKDLG